MSYDLKVVTSLPPTTDAIRAFLHERRTDATVEGQLHPGTGNAVVSVPKRSRQTPIFVLDGPSAIEVEDIEDDVADVVLAPRWLLEINAPITSPASDQRLAKALASFLAHEFQGAAYDPQESVVLWPKRREKRFRAFAKTETRPPFWSSLIHRLTGKKRRRTASENISIVHLRWELSYAKRDRATGELLLKIIRKYCFECLPRRFGDFEPLQGKVTDGDFRAFLDQWEDAAANPTGGLLFFSSTSPCFGGSVHFSDPRDDSIRGSGGQKRVSVGLDFDGRAFADKTWCSAAVDLFVALARGLGAFYAIGYLERGAELHGSRIWYGQEVEIYPLPKSDRWLGIPPVPGWLTWFGPPYATRVHEVCARHVTKEYPEGFLTRLSKQPKDIDALQASCPAFPTELQAKLCEQTLSRQLGKLSPSIVPHNDPRINDGPADVIPPLE